MEVNEDGTFLLGVIFTECHSSFKSPASLKYFDDIVIVKN